MESKTVQVQLQNKYGRDLIYPICQRAQEFLKLTGRKTFFMDDLATIQRLGFEIQWVPASLTIPGGRA